MKDIAHQIVDKLNELHAMDPAVVINMISPRYRCSRTVGRSRGFLTRSHSKARDFGEASPIKDYSLSLIGLLNSVVPFDSPFHVSAEYDVKGQFVRFVAVAIERG